MKNYLLESPDDDTWWSIQQFPASTNIYIFYLLIILEVFFYQKIEDMFGKISLFICDGSWN